MSVVEAASCRIRRGSVADAGALAAFAARTFEETFGAANRPEDMARHLAEAYGMAHQSRELADPDWVSLLVEIGADLAGYAQVRRHPAPECVNGPAPIELHRFYVDRPWHGKGIAQRLMAAVHQTAAELGGQTLWLGVWEHNPRAIAFYLKYGFLDAGSTTFQVGSDRQTDRVLLMPICSMRSGPPRPSRRCLG